MSHSRDYGNESLIIRVKTSQCLITQMSKPSVYMAIYCGLEGVDTLGLCKESVKKA